MRFQEELLMPVDCNDAPVVPDAIAALIDGLNGDADAATAASLKRWQLFCHMLAERYGFCQVWLNRIEAGNRLLPVTGTGMLSVGACPRSCSGDAAENPAPGYLIVRDFCEEVLYRLWRCPHPRCAVARNQAAGAVFACKWRSPQGEHFALTLHGPSKFRRPESWLVDELTATSRYLKDLFETGSATRQLPRKMSLRYGLRPIFPEDRYPQY